MRAATLVLLALALTGSSPAVQPVPSATLAFSRSGLLGGDLFVFGGGRTRLVAPGAVEPAWSPDGRRLAYVAAGAGGADDVFAADADGSHRAWITRTPGLHEASPGWAPDGRRLVLERSGAIVVVRADGSAARNLARGREPAWSPGGGRIAFVNRDDIYLATTTGRRIRRLTSTPATESAPAWAPDGRRLAFVSDATGSPDVHVLNLRTGTVTALTADPAIDASPAFTPDGRRIVFVSDRTGVDALWSAPARGGPARFVGGPAFAAHPRPRPEPRIAELLPDLDQQPPTDLDVRASGRRFLLWFTAAADNVGLGPFIVQGRRQAGTAIMRAHQRVRLMNGSLRTYPRIGVWRYDRSPKHVHWHLLHFQRYELRSANGKVLVRDRKSGFCLGDRYGVAPGRVPHRVRAPLYRGYCNLHEPHAQRVDAGTSVGYSDRYHSRLDGQNLDVTNLAAGRYVLVHRANPQLLIHELRYDNDAASVAIRISWPHGRSRPPAVRILAICADSATC